MKTILKKYPNINGIIHFAALKAVEESVQDPQKYYKNNLLGMIHILMAQQEFNIPHLVFSSSCTVYGNTNILPVTEESPILPAWSPYGHTKQICETMIEDSYKIHPSHSAIILRYFNPIGAHASSHIGEVPVGVPSNLVPYITQTAIGIREELKVYGNDYDSHDGTCIRDYIHVVDLAKAHVIAINRLIEKKNVTNTEIFNLGTGIGYTVLDAINSFEKVSGKKLNYKIVGRRDGDVEKIWADLVKPITYLTELLN
jgi:UDP-glucose 4-epimerase